MAHSYLFLVSLLILATMTTVTSHGWGSRRPRYRCSRVPTDLPENQCLNLNDTRCRLCGKPIDVTIIARNNYRDPDFQLDVTLTHQPQSVLLHFLEQATEANKEFKFESTYFAGLGYFINSINGVRGGTEDQTFWQIISETSGKSLECGVSTYVPVDGETILFNFTTYRNFEH